MEFLKNNNWHIHQNDPDNWLNIPEFNVLPQNVYFKGFAYPILGPTTNDGWQVRVSVWEIVKAVRSQAKKRFKSLADLKAANADLLDRVTLFDKEFTTETYSGDEVFAFRYENIFYYLERCLQFHKNDINGSIVALAHASSDLAEMMIEKPIVSETMHEILSAIGRDGALLRHANDPKQAARLNVKSRWEMWKNNPDEWDSKTAFAKDMQILHPILKNAVSITRWCVKWECGED